MECCALCPKEQEFDRAISNEDYALTQLPATSAPVADPEVLEAVDCEDVFSRRREFKLDRTIAHQSLETRLQILESVDWQDIHVRLRKLEDGTRLGKQTVEVSQHQIMPEAKQQIVAISETIARGTAQRPTMGTKVQASKTGNSIVETGLDAYGAEEVMADQDREPSTVSIEQGVPDDEMNNEVHIEVRLSASMWDVPVVLGCRPLNGIAAVIMLVLLVINVVCQGLFTAIVVLDLSNPTINDDVLLELRTWRRTIAHDVNFFNDRMQRSLASRVCAGDSGLEVANAQAQRHEESVKYLGVHDATFFQMGPILCILALLTFLLMISKELTAIMLRLAAMYSVPKGQTSISYGMDGLHIKQLSVTRAGFCLMVATVRCAVVCILAFFGSLYLVYTVNLGDLILNCVALEIIISLDELIFEALSPVRIKKAFADGPHLAHLRWRRLHGVDVFSGVSLLWTFSALLFVVVAYLQPQLSMLVQMRDALCAGDKDFIFTVDGAGVPAWTYPDGITADHHMKQLQHRNFPDGGSSMRKWTVMGEKAKKLDSYVDRVVDILLQQIGRPYHSSPAACTVDDCFEWLDWNGGTKNLQKAKFDAPPCCLVQKVQVPQYKPGQFSVLAKSRETVLDAINLWNPSCGETLDNLGGYTPSLRNAMGDVVEKDTCGGSCPPTQPMCVQGTCIEPVCADVKPYCTEATVAGVRARQLCPMTCKCHEPKSSLALSLPKEGCGTACYRLGEFREQLKALPCQDLEKDDPRLLAFLDDWNRSSQTWPSDWRVTSGLFVGEMKRMGYAMLNSTSMFAVPYFTNVNFCVESAVWHPIKPLSYFCPVACGCRKGDEHCPGSCPTRTDSEPLCPSYQKKLNWPYQICPMTTGLPGMASP